MSEFQNIEVVNSKWKHGMRTTRVYWNGIEQHPANLGGVREKFVFDNMIVKVDIERDYMHACQEYTIYQSITEEDKKYFPKLLFAHQRRNYIIQEWAQIAPVDATTSTDANRRIVAQLVMKYPLRDVQIHRMPDLNHNWGINLSTNLPIIYDYGLVDNLTPRW